MGLRKRNSQSGFSLVELMVVVAIIGILATLSVGAIQKQIAKTRQSEAKTNLSNLYGAEKGFHAEFGTYASGFGTLKFGVEGNLRYNFGFEDAGYDAGVNFASDFGYTGTVDILNFNSDTFCGSASSTCTSLISASAANVPLAGYSVVDRDTFLAGAGIDNLYRNQPDEWSIDQNKNLLNTIDGIDGGGVADGAGLEASALPVHETQPHNPPAQTM